MHFLVIRAPITAARIAKTPPMTLPIIVTIGGDGPVDGAAPLVVLGELDFELDSEGVVVDPDGAEVGVGGKVLLE